ncbi:MAG: hypothetical protein OXI50_10145 [Gammaproteobacteria bacterium]|nr:hypothetical protein [Gammaproteobacteria bacterium]
MTARFALLALAALTALAAIAPEPVSSQRANRKAVEVIFDVLPPGEQPTFFAEQVGRPPGTTGRALLDDENRSALEQLGYVEVVAVEDVLVCPDFPSPEGCRIRDAGVLYQLVMPEPIAGGRLSMRVVRLIDGAGTSGVIRREVWDILMVPDAEMGWRAVRTRLDATSDGPWAPPPGSFGLEGGRVNMNKSTAHDDPAIAGISGGSRR